MDYYGKDSYKTSDGKVHEKKWYEGSQDVRQRAESHQAELDSRGSGSSGSGGGGGFSFIDRYRGYVRDAINEYNRGSYDRAILSCDVTINFCDNKLSSFHFRDIAADAYNIRGASHLKKGNREQAIADYKMAADLDKQEALKNLAIIGVQYTPRRISWNEEEDKPKRGIVSGIVLGIVSGFSISTLALWIMNGLFPEVELMPVLAVNAVSFLVATVLFFIAWRSRRTIMLLVLIALSIPGAFIMIAKPTFPSALTIGRTAAANTATVNANANFRTGPSTDDSIIRQLQQGDAVILTGETSGGWSQVTHNGETGWISAEFLE